MDNVVKGRENVVAETTTLSYLIPKKVKIRPVPIKKSLFIIGKDQKRVDSEQKMLTGTSRSIVCPIDGLTNRFINPFPDIKERIYFENLLGINLDINKPLDNYLANVRITILKDTDDFDLTFTELDLDNPHDYIAWKICLVAPEVANHREEFYTATQTFFIDDEQVSINDERELNKKEDDCLRYLFGIENSREKLYNFLRTYNLLNKTNRIVPKESKIEWLYNECRALTNSKISTDRMFKLIELIKKDLTSYEMVLFTQDALSIGEILYHSSNNEYRLPSGEKLGNSLLEVEQFLRNELNQLIKERIKAQVKLQLK